VNKYREGKMKRTLRRELKVFEIVYVLDGCTQQLVPSLVCETVWMHRFPLYNYSPVLKHGPRSLVSRQVEVMCLRERNRVELIYKDPKDGELCLSRMKPCEIVVEVRSDTDVQIVRLT
jgi:hypothetical protein